MVAGLSKPSSSGLLSFSGSKKRIKAYSRYKRKPYGGANKDFNRQSSWQSGRRAKDDTPKIKGLGWADDSSDEYDEAGYDKRGYDRDGYSRTGYNKHGFRRHEYGPDGYNLFGYDSEGYDRKGYNLVGLTRADYDVDGYDVYGEDCYGYDRQGLNRYGYQITDYDDNGLDKNGYTSHGLYHGVPGTALIPLKGAMVRRGLANPIYGMQLMGLIRDHATMIISSIKLEREKLLKFQDLITDLSLKWTAETMVRSLGLK